MQRILLFVKKFYLKIAKNKILKLSKKVIKLYIIQQQVPLPLPCFNFTQVTIPALTHKLLIF